MGVFEEVDQGCLGGQGRGYLVGSQPFRLLLSAVVGAPAGQIRLEIFLDFAQLVELLTHSLSLSCRRQAKCQVRDLAADLGELRQGWSQFGLVTGQPIPRPGGPRARPSRPGRGDRGPQVWRLCSGSH